MPLNEDEQRILHEIEQQFYREDPQFAQQVRNTSVYRHAARNVKWAVIGLLLSLAFTFAFFRNLFLGLVGFGLMVGSALFLFHNLRKMGRAGYRDLSTHVQAKGVNVRDVFRRAGRRMRGRFGSRPGDE